MDTNEKRCGSCKAGACSGCGCSNNAMKIIVKIALIVIIFWAGMWFGERKAAEGYMAGGMMQGAMPMMNQ